MQSLQENRARFWERIWFTDDCWPWCGPRNKRGYGQWKFRGKGRKATQIIWEIFRGPIPAGMSVLHECDNPSCVNIGHLFLGTQTDNMRDCAAKGRNWSPRLFGNAHPSSKLTEAKVREIKRLAPTTTHVALGKQFQISRSVVTRILHGQLWAHVK